jgi:hypothetical protein
MNERGFFATPAVTSALLIPPFGVLAQKGRAPEPMTFHNMEIRVRTLRLKPLALPEHATAIPAFLKPDA